MILRVRVTADDIARARRGRACPVALALRRLTGWLWDVGTDFAATPKGRRFALPEAARQFGEDFDLGLRVEPFEFELGADAPGDRKAA